MFFNFQEFYFKDFYKIEFCQEFRLGFTNNKGDPFLLLTMDTGEEKVFKKNTMYETLRQNTYNTAPILNNGLINNTLEATIF